MDHKKLPAHPNLEQYKKQAKDLLKSCAAGDPESVLRIKTCHPRFLGPPDVQVETVKLSLADAQLVIAREHGFASWPKFAEQIAVARATMSHGNVLESFIEAAIWHGPLEPAEAILADHPEIAASSIHVAAILGDDAAIRRLIARDSRNATATAGPYGGDALVYLCFSKYLRFNKKDSNSFLKAATVLLDAGANPNTGFWSKDARPEFESALYGAAGVVQHAALTKLLLDRGGDPNDEETPYHAPETTDNAAVRVLVESGKLTADNLATMLLRKADWHDHEGIQYLLEHGAEPNRMTRWKYTALHQALRRDNHLSNIELMLDAGADPTLENHLDGRTAIAMAARRGRGDVLAAIAGRGIAIELHGVDRLIAACATNDAAQVHAMATSEPQLVKELLSEGGKLLAEFAGNANGPGVRHLLDLGVDVAALYEGDNYFDIARNSTALHVAAWKARPEIVKLLMARRAPVDVKDDKGRTPLALAVRACVDAYWTARRSPESVAALLRAGASVKDVEFPSGYAEVDELLQAHMMP